MNKRQGFTMVELLVVLIILGILISVAAPMYLRNADRSRATEAVAGMGAIRDGEREYFTSHNTYFTITSGNIQNGFPTSVVTTGTGPGVGAPTPATAGVGVDNRVAQYFSNAAYTVLMPAADVDGAGNGFTVPNVQGFRVFVDGSLSAACVGAGATNCAVHNTDVVNYRLEMDNSGRIFVSYDAGVTWQAW